MSPKRVHNISRVLAALAILAMATVLFCCMFMTPAEAAGRYVPCDQRKETAHSIAEQARTLGLSEDDPIIVRAKEIWQEADTEYNTIAVLLAKTTYHEANALPPVEQACVMWCAFNRVDAGYGTIQEVLTAPCQFAYRTNAPVTPELLELSYDVLDRWLLEQAGEVDVGRVLPSSYLWFHGDGKHNYFRDSYKATTYWDYSLPNPYENG